LPHTCPKVRYEPDGWRQRQPGCLKNRDQYGGELTPGPAAVFIVRPPVAKSPDSGTLQISVPSDQQPTVCNAGMAELILFNKPFQVLCQFTDRRNDPDQPTRQTLADWIPLKNVYPAGRLDFDSEGLLLLTGDGALQHRIASPSRKMPKTYRVQVEGDITDDALSRLASGIELKDGKTRPAKVNRMRKPEVWPRVPPVRHRESVPTSWIELTITEGKNRQVRRMTAAVGFPTLRLIRYRIGDWSLDNLAPGQYRVVTVHVPAANRPARHQRHRRRSRS